MRLLPLRMDCEGLGAVGWEAMENGTALNRILESDAALYAGTKTHARGPEGSLPITPEMLLTQPSGNLFGLSQNAGMGWEPARLLDPEVLILSTHGGLRAQDGTPIALGFHAGHWEVGVLVAAAGRARGH